MAGVAGRAEDVYVVQGRADGPLILTNGIALCEAIQWTSDVALYNTGEQDALVRVVGVSNGDIHVPSGDTLLVPSHRSLNLIAKRPNWQGVTSDPLWVLRLDVPAKLQLESILWIGSHNLCVSTFPNPYRFGQVRLPVVYSLTAPQQEQVHLVTTLGGDTFRGRLNVGIYNGSEVQATAHIEIRQHCNNVTIAARTVSVAPNTLTQFGGFSERPFSFLPEDPKRCQGPPFDGTPNAVYTIVTVDQPSFSFVSAIADNATPMASISITSAH